MDSFLIADFGKFITLLVLINVSVVLCKSVPAVTVEGSQRVCPA